MLRFAAGSDAPSGLLPVVEVSGAAGAAANLVAAFAVALFVLNGLGRGRRSVYRSSILLVLLIAVATVGAQWAIHAGAGIALWGFSSVVFGKIYKVRRRLIFSAVAILAFSATGAAWVLYPFAFLLVLRTWNLVGKCAQPGRCGTASFKSGRRGEPVDLTKQPSGASAHPYPVHEVQPAIADYLQDERIPAAARSVLQEIEGRSRAATEYLTQQSLGNGLDAIQVERIRDDYAIGAVRGYLALPPWSAQDVEIADGKTGTQLLMEQLDLLVERLTAIQGSAARTGGEELRTHGQFLKNRFADAEADQLRL